jgi:hypothetical protein
MAFRSNDDTTNYGNAATFANKTVRFHGAGRKLFITGRSRCRPEAASTTPQHAPSPTTVPKQNFVMNALMITMVRRQGVSKVTVFEEHVDGACLLQVKITR